VKWPEANGIFTFMLPRYMNKLDKEINAWHTKPVALASNAFQIPGKKPSKIQAGVYLYLYK
jgi:hypothetical protein